VKKLNLGCISSNLLLNLTFSGCKITAEGMKEISSFLSQNGIVLEELILGLKEKEEISHFNIKQHGIILEKKVVFILLKD